MNILKKASVFVALLLLSFTMLSSYAYAADYTIVPNDSLYHIGVLFNTSANGLMLDNNLSSTMIFPGQKIKVPAEIYTVKSGDTMFLIASRYNLSLEDLRKANNKWDSLIIPGQRLLLPGIKPTESPTGSSQSSSGSSSATATGSGTVISYKSSEVDLLARLIAAEAIGESYDAMVAVGAVVVNRVQKPDWPNSISAVINHVSAGHYQFSPVQNGFIKKPATDDTLRAAWAALYGSDPSKGAIFYYDKTSTNQWIRSKPITTQIGNMIFAK
ncbi:MAG: LysM peptidoglycan-binding domain-containing protein [Herbinix sp.]|nr:LysM peptidoglycan-binding domain-containing protein [Herbinix sp.]